MQVSEVAPASSPSVTTGLSDPLSESSVSVLDVIKLICSCPHTGVDDLPVLVNELHEVFPKWFILGLTLRIPTSKLKQFETTNNRDCSRCMIDMLEAWLRSGNNPSRSQLAEALRAPTVGHNDAAAKIESFSS